MENYTAEPHENSYEDTITKIEQCSACVGFSCLRVEGWDKIQRTRYTDDEVTSVIVPGTMTFNIDYPYNDVQYHKEKSEWLVPLLFIHYRITHNMIVSQSDDTECYHTFPRFINIKRSSGAIQKARTRKNGSIRVVESKSNPGNYNLHISVEFDEEPFRYENIETTELDNLAFIKDAKLKDIAELNPDITNFDIVFKLPKYLSFQYNSHKYLVMKYYCDKHEEWCMKTLRPMIHKLQSETNIKISVKYI